MVRAIGLAGVGLAALAAEFPAAAQTAGPAAQPVTGSAAPTRTTTRTTTYEAAHFAQFGPRTALDIAQHVPGFTLDLGSSQSATGVDVRGFAGTAGNVVINGARPSSKAETLDVTLQHIPAQRVVRVEIGPGDLYGSDYSGKSQVLNIVLSEAGGIDANITAGVVRRHQGYIQGNIAGSALIRRGASTINLSAGTEQNKQFEEGTDTLVDAVTGDLIEFRRKHNTYLNSDPYVAGSYA